MDIPAGNRHVGGRPAALAYCNSTAKSPLAVQVMIYYFRVFYSCRYGSFFQPLARYSASVSLFS